MYVMYDKDRKVKMIWNGRSRGHGPEGQEVTDRKVYRDSGRKSPETHGSEDPTASWPGKAYVGYVVFLGTH